MPETKEYDAQNVSITLDGTTVVDIDSIGYDQSRTHEIQKTVDKTHIWVNGIGEYEGTVAVKATSGNIVNMEDLFQNDQLFNIVISYPDAEPRDNTEFVDCKILDFAPGDYEIESMPVYEASWEAPRVTHNKTE